MKVVIYTRVSTEEQVGNFSLGFQKDECVKYASKNSWQVVRSFQEEGASAKTVQGRPKLLELIKFCQTSKEKIDKVLVYKFDRWARNTEEGLGIISVLAKKGIEVISVTEPSENNAMGKAMRNILLVLAELDNDIKSERTRDGMKAAFNNGHWPWEAPIGYQHIVMDGKKALIAIGNLKPIVRNLFTKASFGVSSKTELADGMNKEGFGKYYSSPATIKTVDRILKNKFYFGLMVAKKWSLEGWGSHERMVDEETWNKVFSNYFAKKSNRLYKLDTEEFPLRRFIKCDNCGKSLTGSFSRGRNEHYPYYHCPNKECDKHVSARRELLESLFISTLKQFTLSPIQNKLLRGTLLEKWEEGRQEMESQSELIRSRIEGIEKERRNILQAVSKGIVTDEEAKKDIETLRAEQVVAEVELAESKTGEYSMDTLLGFAESFLADLSSLWNNLDLTRKRFLQEAIFPKGLSFNGEEFRTVEISQSFELIKAMKEDGGTVVTPEGFEPSVSRMRT